MNERDIELAKQAGFVVFDDYTDFVLFDDYTDGLKKTIELFAAAIRADERERIKAENAPEIERINAYIKSLEDAVRDEREAIIDEWWSVVQADLENGVKCLNEQAAIKWRQEYPSMATFGEWLEKRGNT
jgi:phage host-nuclease inhibitor protein Gam